jgi:hypothetical protein
MFRFTLAAALAAAVAVAVVSAASADVQRYQTQTATLTASVNGGAYVHTYAITINPCGGSFSGLAAAGSVVAGETVTGTLTDSYGTIDFDGLYPSPSDYAWSYDGPLTGGVGHGPNGQTFDVAFTLTDLAASSTWKNHGQYVKAMGGGSAAAQSCLGKPIPFSWSESGTIASTSVTGTAVTLPIAGQYRIDVNGTWTNDGHGWVDAEFTDNGAGGSQDGFPGYGGDFGDLMVGGAFVDWGAFNAAHTYSYTGAFAAGALSLDLAVFDGSGGVPTPGWYGDNTGSLAYTITFVGE